MKDVGKLIFLADDDLDDCLLFEDALKEVNASVKLTTANDGVELLDMLQTEVPPVPDIIFLDLNMPRKNGLECLEQIRREDAYKDIPVVIFSTSAQPETVAKVYEQGADFYIRKPGSFFKLKQAIIQMLAVNWNERTGQASRDDFFLSL